MNEHLIQQQAADPIPLRALVAGLTYKEGWRFEITGPTFPRDVVTRAPGEPHSDVDVISCGTTLIITIDTPNSYNPEQMRRVAHYMPIPPATFEFRSWRRWLLEQIILVEQHEACEFFTIHGEKPYAPNHGPGRNPYTITEVGTETDAATSYLGAVKE